MEFTKYISKFIFLVPSSGECCYILINLENNFKSMSCNYLIYNKKNPKIKSMEKLIFHWFFKIKFIFMIHLTFFSFIVAQGSVRDLKKI